MLGFVPAIRKCRFARRFFARQGADDAACPKARKEEVTWDGGNIDRKNAFLLVGMNPKEGSATRLFITFEGQEGAGKSTQIKLLYEYFLAKGADVILTREPGGTVVAEKIREILKDVANDNLSGRAEALLYVAARAQLVDEVIWPHLAGGGIVLSDRFSDSTIAYQGFGNGRVMEDLACINAFAVRNLAPDITFYLRIDAKAGLARKLTQGAPDRIEQKDLSFHMAVKDGYEYLLNKYPRRIIAIDGELPQDEIHKIIIKNIESIEN